MSKPTLSDCPKGLRSSETSQINWGSDAIVEQLSRLGLRYVALVPGSSYRGVHDSLINYKGNTEPEMLVCLHEEHAVAIAHGYAKVTEKAMAAAVHANVGLMHATMAIYNAYCDRVPMVILGATGPLDAARRRPWIDWIHTAIDQAALIRPFIKFDDQPSSVNAAVTAITHAASVTAIKPSAPVYVCLDVNLQEDKIDPNSIHYPNVARYLPQEPPAPSAEDVERIVKALRHSKQPLFLFGRMNRSKKSWEERIELAELCQALVLTDLKQACTFPSSHKLNACPPGVFVSPAASQAIRDADVVVSFDWVDLGGTLQAAFGPESEPSSTVVHISLDGALHNGWSQDHFRPPPVDVAIHADADKSLSAILASLRSSHSDLPSRGREIKMAPPPSSRVETTDHIFMSDLAASLYGTISPDEICLVRVPLSWKGQDLQVTHPLAFLGQDGGAGVGSGPGQAVGAALALKDSSYLPVAILGDGDFLMASSALWTAARYRLPLLVIAANNASFMNDEVHQERVATARSRPVENKWIGIRIDDPLPDLSQNAMSLGLTTICGQVRDRDQLGPVLKKAVEEAKAGKSVFVDVFVPPDGYASALEQKA